MSFSDVLVVDESAEEDVVNGNGCINKQAEMDGETRSQEDYDEEMIAMVRKCPFLFDNNRVDFKDVPKRQQAWENIGKALGQRPEVVERRWMSLRNQYSKKIREEQMRPLSGSRAHTWRRGHSMAWLKPFIKGRRRRKDVLRVGQMSEWTVRDQQSVFVATGITTNGAMSHASGVPLLSLPENITLPRSIEYSLVTPAPSNGATSTSSQSPSWSPNHRDHRDDRFAAGGGKSFHGSSSSSSSYLRSFQQNNGVPASSALDEGVDDDHAPNSPVDTYPSDTDNSHEFKPFNLCEIQDSKQDVASMVSMVREVVRQELALEDEDVHFARSIAQMLKRMNRPKRNKAKVRLLQLMTDIDAENGD